MTNTATLVSTGTPVDPMPAAGEIFRPATPLPWPSTRSVLDVAVELLPTIDDDLTADLVETLALSIVDREEELEATLAVLSASFTVTYALTADVDRLHKQLRALRDELRTANRKASPSASASARGEQRSC